MPGLKMKTFKTVSVTYPLSPDAQKALDEAKEQWAAAMETVPGYLRNKLNVHQIYSVPALERDADSKFKTAREHFKLKPGSTVHHSFSNVAGKLEHRYYYSKEV
jgi:hypothetical protein